MIFLRMAVPPGMERGLDMSVALLSIALGRRLLVRLASAVSLHQHTHSHGGRSHTHYHLHLRGDAHDGVEHVHLVALGGQPALVGLLHGLAGSAALILGALGAIASPALGMAYLLALGLGSTVGMLALSGLIGLPFARIAAGLAAPRARVGLAALRALAATASIGVGIALVVRLAG